MPAELWVAAVAAAVAAWLLLPDPPVVGRLERWPQNRVRPAGSARAGQSTTPTRRTMVALVAGAAVAVLGSSWLGWASLLLGAAAGTGVGWLVGRLDSAAVRLRRQRSTLQLPYVLDLLSAGLDAGLALRAVSRDVVAACPGPVSEELGRVQHLIEIGMSDVDAWRTLAGHPQLGPMALDLARSVETGTRLTSTLRQHANEARSARRSNLEVRARRVGVHSVAPLMLCFVPAFLLLGIVPTIASALTRAFDLS